MSEGRRNHRYQPVLGHAYLHTVIDDHSRVAYAEIHDDETAQTAIGVLRRAVGWFGVPVLVLPTTPAESQVISRK